MPARPCLPSFPRQWEAGAKVDYGTDRRHAGGLLDLPAERVRQTRPTNTLEVAGQQTNKGLELNVFGEPLEGLRVPGRHDKLLCT